MHQVWPPEVGIGHLQLAPTPCPLGHDFAFFIQKTHFQLEVFTALNKNLVIHQPCKRSERSGKRRRDTIWVTQRAPCSHHSEESSANNRLFLGLSLQ